MFIPLAFQLFQWNPHFPLDYIHFFSEISHFPRLDPTSYQPISPSSTQPVAWPYDDRCPWGSPGSRQIYCSYYPMPYISLHHMHIFIYTYIHVICESYCILYLLYRNHALCKTPGWWVTYSEWFHGIRCRRTASWSWFQTRTKTATSAMTSWSTLQHGQVLQSQLPHWLKKWLTIFPMISSGYVHHIVSLFLLVGYTSILLCVALGLFLHRFRTWIAGEANWRRWLCSFWLQQPAWAAQIVPPQILWFYSLSPENQRSTHQAQGEKTNNSCECNGISWETLDG